jgi:hypothetical protein
MSSKSSKSKAAVTETVTIKEANIVTAEFRIEGISPLVQARFSAKAMQAMMAKMSAGSTAKGKKEREARDYDADMANAMHVSTEGWAGIPAAAFRNGMISACRLIGFTMTLAKLSVFVEGDGFDAVDGVPLVKLDAGQPERLDMAVRNRTGVTDIRVRPMWRQWGATLRVAFDADQFTAKDVANLLGRVGLQVGIGEGRPDSKSSAGMGWGRFRLV